MFIPLQEYTGAATTKVLFELEVDVVAYIYLNDQEIQAQKRILNIYIHNEEVTCGHGCLESQDDPGCHDTEVSEAFEGDEFDLFSNCTKSDGHMSFIPIKEFTVVKLPQKYRTASMAELIQAFADLTVKIKVCDVSESRPDFFTDTKHPYPFSEKRGGKSFRHGTGMIVDVYKCSERSSFWSSQKACSCENCKDCPSNEWAELFICTATHVVFDDAEARNCKCVLFFDLEDCKGVQLDGVSVLEFDVDRDCCRVKFVTCRMDLVGGWTARIICSWSAGMTYTKSSNTAGRKTG